MHEMSIALEVCRIAEDRVGLGALGKVREVGVVVGGASGVEVSSLRFCLETLLAHEPFRGARPVFELTPGDELRVSHLELDDDDPTH